MTVLQRPLCLLALLLTAACAATTPTATGSKKSRDTLRVMSFNLWHGGDAGGQPLDATVAVIREAAADIIGMQEVEGRAPSADAQRPDRSKEIAEALGFHHVRLSGRNAIASRWPLRRGSPGKLGVLIETPHGSVAVFDLHLAHAPYQPYQLASIEYHGGRFIDTAADAIDQADKARGAQIKAFLADLWQCSWQVPTFVVGDFNEPSCLDWTERRAAAGDKPVAVDWPSTRRVLTAGFVDTWREVHSDEVAFPGHTWTPRTAPDDPADRHDRIDFVFARGTDAHAVEVLDCQLVGENTANADIVSLPYPSDHRAVVAEIAIR